MNDEAAHRRDRAAVSTTRTSQLFRLSPSAAAANGSAMEFRPQAYIQLTGERPLRVVTALAAHVQVVVDSSMHGGFESFDGVTLEVDLVAKINDVAGEQSKLGVELDGPGVALVLDHAWCPQCSEVAELNQIASDTLHEPDAALTPRVRSVNGQFAVLKHESHGRAGALVHSSAPRCLRHASTFFQSNPPLRRRICSSVSWCLPMVLQYSTILENVRPGSIILLHVEMAARDQERAALVELLPRLRERGYRLVTVSELMAAGVD
jgi:hypothetical protein